jgi:acetyl esterase/lipase
MTTRWVPVRELPVPDTVSPLMQTIIAGLPEHSHSAALAPQSDAQWHLLAEQRQRAGLEQVGMLQRRFKLTLVEQCIGGVACYEITPEHVLTKNAHRLAVNLHSGGHVFGSGVAGTLEATLMAGLVGVRVLTVDYRMPLDFPFPHAMNDATAVWRELVAQTLPSRIALFGFSSGGGMALSLVQRLRDEGLPLPAALMVGTPWSDLSKTGDSYFANAGVDNGVVAYEGLLEAAARLYSNGRDLKDPLVSPVYGDFAGFPPTLLTTGTRDLFLSNTVRVHRKLRRAGVPTQLDVYEGQSHGSQYLNVDAPETHEQFGDVGRFFDSHLAT